MQQRQAVVHVGYIQVGLVELEMDLGVVRGYVNAVGFGLGHDALDNGVTDLKQVVRPRPDLR